MIFVHRGGSEALRYTSDAKQRNIYRPSQRDGSANGTTVSEEQSERIALYISLKR